MSVIEKGILGICSLMLRKGNRRARRKTGPRATSFITNPTRAVLVSNPDLCNEKPATNSLNQDTVLFLAVCILSKLVFTGVYSYFCFMTFLVQIIDVSFKIISICQIFSDVSAQSTVRILSEFLSKLYLFTDLRTITRDCRQLCHKCSVNFRLQFSLKFY